MTSQPNQNDIIDYAPILDTLKHSGVILYPTDTVWGLGCDATDPEAVAKIFAIKQRSESKSLVLLASDMDMICRFVREVPSVAADVATLSTTPMTVIYSGAVCAARPSSEENGIKAVRDPHLLAWNCVADDGSVGIRIPLMGFCINLVRKFGRPIVSTSANISGEPTPKNFAEISPAIKSAVDLTVDPSLEKESCGKPSSIIKIDPDGCFKIIR